MLLWQDLPEHPTAMTDDTSVLKMSYRAGIQIRGKV